MLNIVAVQVVTYLLRGPLIDPAQADSGARIPQTKRLSPNADLPILLGGTRLHLGVVIAVAMAVAGVGVPLAVDARVPHPRRRRRPGCRPLRRHPGALR